MPDPSPDTPSEQHTESNKENTTMDNTPNTISIDGTDYVRAEPSPWRPTMAPDAPTPDPSPAEVWAIAAQQSSAKWSAAARQRVVTEHLGVAEIASANDLQLIAAAAHAHMERVRSW